MPRTWDAFPITGDAPLAVRRIGLRDLRDVLRLGWRDFADAPTQVVFLCLIYPLVGLVLARAASGGNLLPLIYPMLSGFVLVAPLFALGIYELSRRMERGEEVRPSHMLAVLRAPSIGSILLLGALLLAVFTSWLWAARGLYDLFLGPGEPASLQALLREVTATRAGWTMLLAGNVLGALFAVLVLGMVVISFPLMLDRGVGLRAAVATSMAALRRNPLVLLAWGAVVALLLAAGMAVLFVGLAVVLPWLGHATWHLYRRLTG